MNVVINHSEICRKLSWLVEVLSPREICRSLFLNQLDFYYAAYCARGSIPQKILEICGESLKKSIRSTRTAIYTIDYLNKLLNKAGINYVYIKTYRPLPYALSDIDLFIRSEDFPNLMRLLRAEGFKIVKHGIEIRCHKKGMTRVDVYSSIIYAGIEFKINDLLLSTKILEKFLGDLEIFIPTKALDALLLLIHDILGHRSLNYLDCLYIKQALSDNFNSKILQSILNCNTKEVNLIARCLDLFFSLQYKCTSDSIEEFPIIVSPSLVFNIIDNISSLRKFVYGSSLLIDNLLQFYNEYSDAIPTELKKIVQTMLFYHRLIIGDRHFARR
ncbi:MAG: hypothetical protein QXE05_07750 [Nitrososphaeria archaeon]